MTETTGTGTVVCGNSDGFAKSLEEGIGKW